jgi:hypothetical protein
MKAFVVETHVDQRKKTRTRLKSMCDVYCCGCGSLLGTRSTHCFPLTHQSTHTNLCTWYRVSTVGSDSHVLPYTTGGKSRLSRGPPAFRLPRCLLIGFGLMIQMLRGPFWL